MVGVKSRAGYATDDWYVCIFDRCYDSFLVKDIMLIIIKNCHKCKLMSRATILIWDLTGNISQWSGFHMVLNGGK